MITGTISEITVNSFGEIVATEVVLTGSIQEVGLKGDRGEQGIPGTAAFKGDKGDKGEPGTKGDPGTNGVDATPLPTNASGVLTNNGLGVLAWEPVSVDLSATADTGSLISFTEPKVYNSVLVPSISNITNDLTGAKIGIVQKIYHNHSTAPTFPAGWVKVGGSYAVSSLNIIYCEWVSGTRVEYWIVQG